jgi:hypothetical protein
MVDTLAHGSDDDDEGGAQVIDAGGKLFRYIWVYEPQSRRLEMYRYSGGDWKVMGGAEDYPRTFQKLQAAGQLNEVTSAEMDEFEAEMRRRNEETVARLEQWWEEEKSDEQRRVEELLQLYFDEQVLPVVERGFADVDRGVLPFDFEYRPQIPRSKERQAKQHVLNAALGRAGFYSPYGTEIERYVLDRLGKQDVDDLEDPQSIQWAASDLAHHAYDTLMPLE